MWSTFALSLVLPFALAVIPPNAEWYTLSAKAKVNTVNNLFLSAKNGKIGAFAGARESAQVGGKFFISKYDGTQTLSLHAGDDSHQLGLQIQGTKGLLLLVDLVNPSGDTIPKDMPTEWSVFDIAKNGEFTVKDGQNIPTRKWISYLDTDGVYYVGLWDGVTRQPRSFANITLTATKISVPPGGPPPSPPPLPPPSPPPRSSSSSSSPTPTPKPKPKYSKPGDPPGPPRRI